MIDDPGVEKKVLYKRQVRRVKRDAKIRRETAQKIAAWLASENLVEIADEIRKKFGGKK